MNFDVSKKSDGLMGPDAIIAIDSDNNGHLILMLTEENWKLEAHSDYDPLPEIEFNELPGLYYANMTGTMCGISCTGYSCAGDCFEVDWEIVKPIYIIKGGNEEEDTMK